MSSETFTNVPWSNEAEQGVLGAVLFDNRAWDRIADLLVEADFYSPAHREAFAAIGRLIVSGHPADAITVSDELLQAPAAASIDLAYLNGLAQSVPSAANARRYAEVVRKHAARRSLIATLDEALLTAREQPDVAGAVDEISTKLGQLQLGRSTAAPRSIAEIAVGRVEHYEALERGEVAAGWPTHIPALDARLNGGLRAGSLYILAARPSVGKSSLAQRLGLGLAGDGLPTLFLSMEMDATEVADRAVASSGRVSYSALLTGKMDHEHWARATEAIEHLARLPFHVDDEPALTLRAIRAKAKSIRGLKVLIVDYLQLCAGRRRDGNRNSEIEEISRGLKALAKELGLAVIALSQLNRDVEKRATRRPTLSDLRDSGAIEQDADVVLFLWPVREFDNEGRRVLGLGIDKNRQGRLGEIGLDFFGDTQRWQQSTADIRSEPAPRPRRDDL